MEERALPPPVPASPEPASSAVSTAFGSPLDPVAVPPARHVQAHDTYIVHVQKDQVYRVPPPENAYLAERYRAERAVGDKSGAACSPCVLRTLGVAVVAALLLGAAVALSVVVLRPGAPSFTVDRLSLHNASRQERTDYGFFLTAINPNRMTALWYKDGGKATLLQEGAALAKGDVGKPEVGGEDATDFNVLLHGLQHDGPTAKAVEKGLRGSKKGARVALDLSVEFVVQVHVGALGCGTKTLAVECEITAAGSRKKDVHISSQNCKGIFGN